MQGDSIATRPIRRKLTGLAWLLAGAALPALAQTPSAPHGNAVAATDGGIDVAQLKPAVRQKMIDGIRRTARAVTEMPGAPEAEIRIPEGGKPWWPAPRRC
ncbi:exported protein of unknown function [Ralstonia solanacearum CMR15]|nr:exported protein of unknown function [Ralstonia solanacearum CMR15]